MLKYVTTESLLGIYGLTANLKYSMCIWRTVYFYF
jgi:hypothetical protein